MAGEAVTIEAPAKVNLSLRVRTPDATGLHLLLSLVQSFDCHDRLTAAPGDNDRLEFGEFDLPAGRDNLIWRAVDAFRAETGESRALSFRLEKRIPVAAGLAGGSADAAAALLAVASLSGLRRENLREIAATVGADVPFALQGGLAWMEGHGELLTAIRSSPPDYSLAVVVPPFGLDTPAVYQRWDRLGGPEGEAVVGKHLPPSLRAYEPFGNDLFPAALDLRPDLGDWRSDLSDQWERPVMLSGSGPSLFAYFADRTEASEAIALAPEEARSHLVLSPVSHGARVVENFDSVGEPTLPH